MYLKSLMGGLSLAGIAACSASQSSQPEPTTYRVFYLGGQSNMDGYGFNENLPDAFNRSVPNVIIFNGHSVADGGTGGGEGEWMALQPGLGVGYQYKDGEPVMSGRFGPELTFGTAIRSFYPFDNIAIIKYSRGGSSLALDAPNYGTWDPAYDEGNGLNQYDNFLTTLSNAKAVSDINGDGVDDILEPEAIIWMQGESDAINEGPALVYEDNLSATMSRLRSALGVADLPVVIGKITDSGMDDDGKVMDHIELVQAAQAAFVAKDPCAAYVTEIDDYTHSDDAWHYDSEAYLRMGEAFARAAAGLIETCGSEAP